MNLNNTVLRNKKKLCSRDVGALTVENKLSRPPMSEEDLQTSAGVDIQILSEEALQPAGKRDDRSGTAVQIQTQEIANVETPAQPPIYVHSGEVHFSRQMIADMLVSCIRSAIQNHPVPSTQGIPDGHTTAQTAHTSGSPLLDPHTMQEAVARTKKRQRVKEEERVYKRVKKFNTCRSCGQPKLKETGHRGFKGYSFCPKSGQTYEAFLADVKNKKRDTQ